MSKKLDSLLESFQKKYKVTIQSATDACKADRLTLDSPGLNFALGGGLVPGRVYHLQGPESGGKSTLSTYIASQVQKHYTGKNTVVYVDFEYTFDDSHAREMGLDTENNFILLRPLNGEDGFDMIMQLVDTGEIGLVIIDSTTTISSKAQVEDWQKATFGGQAKVLSDGLRTLNPHLYNNKCSLILISQERASMSMYGADFKATGGYAPKYYSSWMARVTRTGDIIDPQTKELVGIEMRVRNIKNKIGIPKRDATLKLYFNGGIRSDDEYIDYLKALGLVEQKGAYYSNPDWVSDSGVQGMKVCGLEAVKDWLHDNPKMYEKVKVMVNERIAGHTSIDEEESVEDVGDPRFTAELPCVMVDGVPTFDEDAIFGQR